MPESLGRFLRRALSRGKLAKRLTQETLRAYQEISNHMALNHNRKTSRNAYNYIGDPGNVGTKENALNNHFPPNLIIFVH